MQHEESTRKSPRHATRRQQAGTHTGSVRGSPRRTSSADQISADPKQKLLHAEHRAARRAKALHKDWELSEFIVEDTEDDGWSRALPNAAPASDGSAPPFGAGTSRMSPGPTERSGTSGSVGPGSYVHDRDTLASTMSEKNRTPRFAFGVASPREELQVTAAQMAYEVNGNKFLEQLEKHPDGWLRTDYHRWLVAASNRSEYIHHRNQVELARQQKEDDDKAYRANGAKIVAAQIATRKNASNEIKNLRERRLQAGQVDKRDSGCRSRLLKARSEAWQKYAASCVEEARQTQESARLAKSREEQRRARIASEMRAQQRQQEHERRQQDERRVDEVRATREVSRFRGRSVDWRSADICDDAAFKALTADQKAAVDEANAEAAAARERAKDRAKIARRKEKEASMALAPARVSKNLTELVKEDTVKRIAEQKEKARLEAEREAHRAAADAAAEAAEQAAAAEAIRIAEEAAQAAAAVAAEAAELAQRNKEKRERAKEQKQFAAKLKGRAAMAASTVPTSAPASVTMAIPVPALPAVADLAAKGV